MRLKHCKKLQTVKTDEALGRLTLLHTRKKQKKPQASQSLSKRSRICFYDQTNIENTV